MAALADFAQYVRPEVPGCPEIMILDALRQAGIEFCERTKVLRQTLVVNTVVDTASYDLAALVTAGTEPDEILFVSRDNGDLEPSSEYEFQANNLDQSGSPQYYYLDGTTMVVGFKPTAVEALTVRVKTRPAEAASTLPDELYRRYRREIAAGAKTQLMLMANQPWSNPQQAAIYNSIFNGAVDDENLRHAKGGDNKTLRTTLHMF